MPRQVEVHRRRVDQNMEKSELLRLFFDGMEKLGPGDNVETLKLLRLLPHRQLKLVVDAGCGAGRQTMALAAELGVQVHAIDCHQPFLNELERLARERGIDQLVQTHHMDIQTIPKVFREVDLLWSEGAAYNIGFAHALNVWKSALAPGGLAVVSELSWLRDEVPAAVRDFFRLGYPDMNSVAHNVGVAKSAGYALIKTYTLPAEAWVHGYYDVLGPRAIKLLRHKDRSVRDFAAETLLEIEAFNNSDGSYGYVFYVLQRP